MHIFTNIHILMILHLTINYGETVRTDPSFSSYFFFYQITIRVSPVIPDKVNSSRFE